MPATVLEEPGDGRAANRPWPTKTPAAEDEEATEPTDGEEVADVDESSLVDEHMHR